MHAVVIFIYHMSGPWRSIEERDGREEVHSSVHALDELGPDDACMWRHVRGGARPDGGPSLCRPAAARPTVPSPRRQVRPYINIRADDNLRIYMGACVRVARAAVLPARTCRIKVVNETTSTAAPAWMERSAPSSWPRRHCADAGPIDEQN